MACAHQPIRCDDPPRLQCAWCGEVTFEPEFVRVMECICGVVVQELDGERWNEDGSPHLHKSKPKAPVKRPAAAMAQPPRRRAARGGVTV